MKILLIMPYHTDLIHTVSLPLGILSIASYLKQNGYEVRICDLSVKKQSVAKVCDDFKPDIAGVSFPSCKAIDGIVNVSKILRKKNIPVVWGGSFSDVGDARHFFDTGLVDIVSFSEGESTWLELLKCLESGGDLAGVSGIAYLKDGSLTINPQRDFMDPAELPKLDFGLVDVPAYFQYLYGCKKLVYVYLSKGCPAHCTFCVNTPCHRNTRRRRNVDVFMSEINELVTVYGADGFYFADELAFLNERELYEVCDGFDKINGEFFWGFQNRIGLFGEDALKRAYASGCRWIDYGVESGNKEMLARVKKNIDYDKIEHDFEMCSRAGIISIANFIIGFPGETEKQLKDSVDLAKRIPSTQNTFAKYIYVPSTPAGREIADSGVPCPAFNKLNDYKQMDFFANTQGLSRLPQKELNVVQSHFLWKAIFRKDYGSTREYDLLFKSVMTVVKRVGRMPFVCACKALKEITFDFTRFFVDEKFDKKIHKKYGLD